MSDGTVEKDMMERRVSMMCFDSTNKVHLIQAMMKVFQEGGYLSQWYSHEPIQDLWEEFRDNMHTMPQFSDLDIEDLRLVAVLLANSDCDIVYVNDRPE
jgi:hypothetical protein